MDILITMGSGSAKERQSLGCVLGSEDGMVFGEREVQDQKNGWITRWEKED